MHDFSNIVIYHPGAIGDVMLATPVAATLKKNFPAAKITHVTHASLKPLLQLCPDIDDIQSIDKRWPFMRQRACLLGSKPQLVVDLSGSTRGRFLTMFSGAKTVHYQKQNKNEVPRMHAVDNFLETLESLKLPETAGYPTAFPTDILKNNIRERIGATADQIIGIVPGVGHLRSHRGWTVEHWIELISRLSNCTVLLIGGTDDQAIAAEIAGHGFPNTNCVNLTGLLSLPETAAALSLCEAVVSGDTGPAHIAVAVGKPVIGLYGPTYPDRSGPYGYRDLVVDQSHHCRCHNFKSCQITAAAGPGDCMAKLPTDEVWMRLSALMKLAR